MSFLQCVCVESLPCVCYRDQSAEGAHGLNSCSCPLLSVTSRTKMSVKFKQNKPTTCSIWKEFIIHLRSCYISHMLDNRVVNVLKSSFPWIPSAAAEQSIHLCMSSPHLWWLTACWAGTLFCLTLAAHCVPTLLHEHSDNCQYHMLPGSESVVSGNRPGVPLFKVAFTSLLLFVLGRNKRRWRAECQLFWKERVLEELLVQLGISGQELKSLSPFDKVRGNLSNH